MLKCRAGMRINQASDSFCQCKSTISRHCKHRVLSIAACRMLHVTVRMRKNTICISWRIEGWNDPSAGADLFNWYILTCITRDHELCSDILGKHICSGMHRASCSGWCQLPPIYLWLDKELTISSEEQAPVPNISNTHRLKSAIHSYLKITCRSFRRVEALTHKWSA